MLFLPGARSGATPAQMAGMVAAIEEAVGAAGIEVVAWRRVPVGTFALGDGALDTLPEIQQLIMKRPARFQNDDDGFERALYITRKKIENKIRALNDQHIANGEAALPFYAASFSHRTLCYKGLVVADNMCNLFPDLNDSDFQTALAVFHQRYSTNTFPQWATAQPFRAIAHNGEFNTVEGNINWVKMREETLQTDLFGEGNSDDLKPII